MATKRWSQRPAGSNWADFGPDDQLGRLNLITEETVRNAAREIRVGKTFCLSLPLDRPGGTALNPFRKPPQLMDEMLPDGSAAFNASAGNHVAGATDVFCDGAVSLSLQYSTHWDGLSHVGQMFDLDDDGEAEVAYYNGFDPAVSSDQARTVPAGKGARSLSIDRMAESCVQGRGVLVDIERHHGRANALIGYDDLMRIIEFDKIEVRSGDFVCLHTGFAKMMLEMGYPPDKQHLEASTAALDGRDEKLQDWITASGIVAIAADNYAVERLPAREGASQCCASLPLHEHCIYRLGVYLGELWYLSELAESLRELKRNSFFLTAPPLRLPGAVASPVTPVATI